MSNEQKNTIYISYADADEEWVISFVNDLKVYLRGQLGEISDDFIWAKYMLKGFEDKVETPQQRLQNSTYLFVIFSNAYLRTTGNKDIELHNDINTVFAIEHDEIKLPESLQAKKGYQFWDKDERNNITRLALYGNKEPKYYQLLDEIAHHINEHLTQNSDEIPDNENEKITIFLEEIEGHAENTIFLANSVKYKEKRNKLKVFLEEKGYQILPNEHYSNYSFDLVDVDLEESAFFIQIDENDDDIAANEQRDKAKKLGLPILILSATKPNVTSKLAQMHKEEQVFINAIKDDKELAFKVKKELSEYKINSFLPLPLSENKDSFSRKEQQEIDDKLLNCDAIIILCSEYPLNKEWGHYKKWAYYQIQNAQKICVKRIRAKKPNIKIIAVFNKPPPDNIEQILGIEKMLEITPLNFKVWNCTDIVNQCIPKFKKVFLP